VQHVDEAPHQHPQGVRRRLRRGCGPESIFGSGQACTPAAQIFVRAAIRSWPSRPFTVMLSSVIAIAAVSIRRWV
jgi:hypothetical protein